MASSPTRSGTLRPHFLMAVGLGPAQGALSPERRDAPTPRTWPGSRTGSQPHHLSARAAPRGPQAPGSPRPAGSGSRAGDAALQRTGRPSSRPPGSVLPQRTAVGPVGDVGPRLLRILAMKRSPAVTASRRPAGRAVRRRLRGRGAGGRRAVRPPREPVVRRQLLLPVDDHCFCRFRSSWIENQQPRSRAITAERRDDLRRESCRSCGHVFSSRPMTAKEKEAVSERMKASWAARRKKAAK